MALIKIYDAKQNKILRLEQIIKPDSEWKKQ